MFLPSIQVLNTIFSEGILFIALLNEYKAGYFQATGTPKMQSQTDNFTILKLW
jgi:hypothetical protein